jgi:hypothetical protein
VNMSAEMKALADSSRANMHALFDGLRDTNPDQARALEFHQRIVLAITDHVIAMAALDERQLALLTQHGFSQPSGDGGQEFVLRHDEVPAAAWDEFTANGARLEEYEAKCAQELERFVSTAAALYNGPLREHFLWFAPIAVKFLTPEQLATVRLKCPHVTWPQPPSFPKPRKRKTSMQNTSEILNPVREFRLADRTVTVRELPWRDQRVAMDRIIAQINKMLSPGTGALPAGGLSLSIDTVIDGIKESADLAEWFLEKCAGLTREQIAALTVTEFFTLLEAAIDLNVVGYLTGAKKAFGRITSFVGSGAAVTTPTKPSLPPSAS